MSVEADIAVLSDGQKRAIMSARIVTRTELVLHSYRDGGKLVRSIQDAGLAKRSVLTRRGLAVHKRLHETTS